MLQKIKTIMQLHELLSNVRRRLQLLKFYFHINRTLQLIHIQSVIYFIICYVINYYLVYCYY